MRSLWRGPASNGGRAVTGRSSQAVSHYRVTPSYTTPVDVNPAAAGSCPHPPSILGDLRPVRPPRELDADRMGVPRCLWGWATGALPGAPTPGNGHVLGALAAAPIAGHGAGAGHAAASCSSVPARPVRTRSGGHSRW